MLDQLNLIGKIVTEYKLNFKLSCSSIHFAIPPNQTIFENKN
jgi:hypothetical protein